MKQETTTTLQQADCIECSRPLRWQSNVDIACGCKQSTFHASCVAGLRSCPVCKKNIKKSIREIIAKLATQESNQRLIKEREKVKKIKKSRKLIEETTNVIIQQRKHVETISTNSETIHLFLQEARRGFAWAKQHESILISKFDEAK